MEVEKPQVSKPKDTFWDWGKTFIKYMLAAWLINIFIIEGFIIPSSSMENTLFEGDYVMVNKLHFGPRLPITPLTVPFTNSKLNLYSNAITLPYFRLWGYNSIKTNDVIVFNIPNALALPIDKKEYYIKRCIGLPGDSIKLIQKQVFRNNTALVNPSNLKIEYFLRTNNVIIPIKLLDSLGINEGGRYFTGEFDYLFSLSQDQLKCMKKQLPLLICEPNIDSLAITKQEIYPNNTIFKWSKDNFGSIYIPKKNDTIALNDRNLALYSSLIKLEEPKATFLNSKLLINNIEQSTYCFKENYYFMLGDNRDLSIDSRYWGLVPESHIVGKASFVLFAKTAKGFNWNRLLKAI